MHVLLFAALTTIGDIPPWTYPDTEVSTNVVHRFSDPNASEFRLLLDAETSPTNAVTVAFGRDADGDGVLSLDETDFRAGWDCGEWFACGALPADAVIRDEPEDDPIERRRRIVWRLHRRPLDWDLCRVTLRGLDTPAVRVTTGTFAEGFVIRMK